MKEYLRLGLVAALVIGAASPAAAQEAAPLGYDAPVTAADSVVALSPQAREATLNAAAEQEHDLPINGLGSRRVHGEMGIEIGSRGTRAMYGTVAVPLGDSASASFSYLMATQNALTRR